MSAGALVATPPPGYSGNAPPIAWLPAKVLPRVGQGTDWLQSDPGIVREQRKSERRQRAVPATRLAHVPARGSCRRRRRCHRRRLSPLRSPLRRFASTTTLHLLQTRAVQIRVAPECILAAAHPPAGPAREACRLQVARRDVLAYPRDEDTLRTERALAAPEATGTRTLRVGHARAKADAVGVTQVGADSSAGSVSQPLSAGWSPP